MGGAKTGPHNVCIPIKIGRLIFSGKSGGKTAALHTAILFREHLDGVDDTTIGDTLQGYNSRFGTGKLAQHSFDYAQDKAAPLQKNVEAVVQSVGEGIVQCV